MTFRNGYRRSSVDF